MLPLSLFTLAAQRVKHRLKKQRYAYVYGNVCGCFFGCGCGYECVHFYVFALASAYASINNASIVALIMVTTMESIMSISRLFFQMYQLQRRVMTISSFYTLYPKIKWAICRYLYTLFTKCLSSIHFVW